MSWCLYCLGIVAAWYTMMVHDTHTHTQTHTHTNTHTHTPGDHHHDQGQRVTAVCVAEDTCGWLITQLHACGVVLPAVQAGGQAPADHVDTPRAFIVICRCICVCVYVCISVCHSLRCTACIYTHAYMYIIYAHKRHQHTCLTPPPPPSPQAIRCCTGIRCTHAQVLCCV